MMALSSPSGSVSLHLLCSSGETQLHKLMTLLPWSQCSARHALLSAAEHCAGYNTCHQQHELHSGKSFGVSKTFM